MKTIEELKAAITDSRIHISEQNGIYYADVVEDNGDEDRVTQSKSLDDLFLQLKNFGLAK